MSNSRNLQPDPSPFFPHIFFRNQFRSTPKWPPADTNLDGKTAIITGANQGLGLEASEQFLALGLSRLILAVRTKAKGEGAAKALAAKYPKARIDVLELEMSSYDSIRTFVSEVEQLDRIDIVILNAGLRKMKFEVIESTKHEETLQINYWSTALLAILLLPILKERRGNEPARLSVVGSGLMLAAKFRNKDKIPLLASFDSPANFDSLDTYNVTKLLIIMFVDRLSTFVSAEDVIINVVDPGFVAGTSLSREISFLPRMVMTAWKGLVARSVKVGASTYVDAAVMKGKESHGCFVMSWAICPLAPIQYTEEGKVLTERLWEETLAEFTFVDASTILSSLGHR